MIQYAQEVKEPINRIISAKGGNLMNENAAAARRAYKRKWARENPEKVRAQQERYWSKKAAEAAKIPQAAAE